MLVLETKPLVDAVDSTGAADAFIGPLALQLTSSLRDQFKLSNQVVRRLPLACALASLSLRHRGASSAYAATYGSAAAADQGKPKKKGNPQVRRADCPDGSDPVKLHHDLNLEALIENYLTSYGERRVW